MAPTERGVPPKKTRVVGPYSSSLTDLMPGLKSLTKATDTDGPIYPTPLPTFQTVRP